MTIIRCVKTIEFEVNMTEVVDSLFNHGCNLYEALAEQGIDEDLLDDLFSDETLPEVKEKLKLEMGRELLNTRVDD